MRSKVLLTVDVVTDDDTGIWSIGELEYGVPIETRFWLEAKPDRRKLLADWMRMLAERCEASQAPFGDSPVGSSGEAQTEHP